MRRLRVHLVLLALALLAGCGGDDGAATPAEEDTSLAAEQQETTVQAILEDPAAFEERVALEGTASPAGDEGFVLEGSEGAAIFVSAALTEARKIDDGERVQVIAELDRLTDVVAERLRKAAAGQTDTTVSVDAAALERLPPTPAIRSSR